MDVYKIASVRGGTLDECYYRNDSLYYELTLGHDVRVGLTLNEETMHIWPWMKSSGSTTFPQDEFDINDPESIKKVNVEMNLLVNGLTKSKLKKLGYSI